MPSAKDQAHTVEIEASVAADDPVITIPGICPGTANAGTEKDVSCKTVVSKHDFETLMNALNLNGQPMSPAARQNLAKTYAEYIAYEQPAKKAGLEDTARYAEIMRWLRLRILTDLYRQKIYDQFHTPSDAEIASYYTKHVAEFERAKIARILVPRNASANANDQDHEKKVLAVAEQARQRAIKGDDLEQIQKDVYADLGASAPPPTDLGNQARKDFIPGESEELFALQPGAVSKVETELTAYVIYKVISRETPSQSQVKDQIAREISRDNIEKANDAITGAVQPEYNGKYFGPPANSSPTAPIVPVHP